MPVAVITDPRYLEHDTGPAHPECPERLKILYGSLHPLESHLHSLPPRLAAFQELSLVHSPGYLRNLQKTADKGGGLLDPDTPVSPESFEVARLAAGGTLRAVEWVLEESDRQAFVLCRPPGHHAEPDRGMGFCLINNIAVAARYLQKNYGLSRILIVDWDVHHGNGTQRAFYGENSVLFFSTHQFPYYPGSGDIEEIGFGPGEGFTVNLPFPAGYGDGEYIESFRRILLPIARQYSPEIILVSAGFDAYFMDPLAEMEVHPHGFARLASMVLGLAREYCSGRLLMTLEGGYHLAGLRDCVLEVLKTMLNDQTTHPEETTPRDLHLHRTFADLMERVQKIHRPFWKAFTE